MCNGLEQSLAKRKPVALCDSVWNILKGEVFVCVYIVMEIIYISWWRCVHCTCRLFYGNLFIGSPFKGNVESFEEQSGNRLQCEYCFKACSNAEEHSIHINNDHKSKEYVCNICGEKFKVKEDFHEHISNAHGRLARQCGICGKGFKSIAGYRNHITVFHSDTSQLPKCHYCGKVFPSIAQLTRHLKLHTGEKDFWCASCNKYFSDKRSLKKHRCIYPFWGVYKARKRKPRSGCT